jgi:hypothetical protein
MTKVISTVLNWGDAARRIDIQHLINEGVL